MWKSLTESDAWVWEMLATAGGWGSHPLVVAVLVARWIGLASFAPGLGSVTVSFRFRLVLSLLLAGLMAGDQREVPGIRELEYSRFALLLTGEFIVGVGLGLVVSLWLAAVRSAGEWISLLSGLKIQTTYQPDWDGDAGDIPSTIGRLFSLAGMAMFFAARGPMRLIELVDSSMESLPPGGMLKIVHQHQAEAMFAFVDEALTLSLLAAWPIVLALITAEVAVMLATRTQSVALSWSLLAPTRLAIGMFILAAGFMGISVGVSGTLDSWLEMSGQRFSRMVRSESAEGTDQKIRPIEGGAAR